MAKLPQKLPLPLMQTQWAQQIEPTLSFPPVRGTLLTNISLATGVNTINTMLGRMMQGWIITDQTSSASIYRSAPMNDLTLQLTSSAPTTINLWVF